MNGRGEGTGRKAKKRGIIKFEMTKLTKKINLVYGGGTVGLMGTVARTILNGGGKVTGIIPKALSPKEISSEMIGDVTYPLPSPFFMGFWVFFC